MPKACGGIWEESTMKFSLGLLAFASLLAFGAAHAQGQNPGQGQGYAVAMRNAVPYAEHDGVKLTGDLYLPKGLDKSPVVIAVYGGGWQAGSPATYRHWGPYLAGNG